MLFADAGVREGSLSLSLSVATGTSSDLCLLAKLLLASYFTHCMCCIYLLVLFLFSFGPINFFIIIIFFLKISLLLFKSI
jgi:hypothetical protein